MTINPNLVSAPWTDDRTLDELEGDDKKQLEKCWQKAQAYHFKNLNEARAFMGESMRAALSKMGVPLDRNTDPNRLDGLMKHHNVKVEHRINYPADEAWRRGLYIYKNEELAVFISHPVVNSPTLNKAAPSRIIVPENLSRYVLWTNAWSVANRLNVTAAG